MAKKAKSVADLVRSNQDRDIAKLSAEGKIFAEFLMLIVDIKYRNKYGEQVANQNASVYSDQVQPKNVVADQVTPVDDGLLRHSQRELFDL